MFVDLSLLVDPKPLGPKAAMNKDKKGSEAFDQDARSLR